MRLYNRIVMKQTLTDRKKTLSFLLILGLSLVHCFFSIDWDEEYTMLVAGQIAQGYGMFDGIWSSHQTSALFLAPLIALWRLCFGNQSLVLGVRILSVLVVFAAALVIYFVLRSFLDDTVSFLISVTFFLLLPRGTISLEYGVLQMCFVSLTTVFLLAAFHTKQQKRYIVLSALAWSAAVLCYPFLVFVTPVILIGILLVQKQDRWRSIIVFTLTCLLCGAVFLTAVLSGTSLNIFLGSLKTILSDPRHSGGFLSRITGSAVLDLLKKLIILLGGCALFLGSAYLLVRKTDRAHRTAVLRLLCLLSPFASYALVMLGGNLTGVYRTGCMGIAVGFVLFFLVSLFVSIRNRSREELWICIFGFAVYLAAFIQGNLSFKDYVNYLYLPLFLLIYQTWKTVQDCRNQKTAVTMVSLVMIAFLSSLLYTKAFCVRIDGVGYSTVFENRRNTAGSLYHGVFLYPDQGRVFAQKEQVIDQYTECDDVILLADANVSLNFAANGKYIFVCALDGVVSDMDRDPRWIQYMETHFLPDKVFIDKEVCPDWNDFFKGETGSFLLEHKNIGSIEESDVYHVVSLKD